MLSKANHDHCGIDGCFDVHDPLILRLLVAGQLLVQLLDHVERRSKALGHRTI